MVFLINKCITFDNVECSLSNKDTNDKLLLPAIASRLLSLFIKHHGTVLTREDILDRVWDSYGYRSSNNTLTQYVSLLRKNFQLLGETTEIIITIPRVGLLIPEEIKIKPYDGELPDYMQRPDRTDAENHAAINISHPVIHDDEQDKVREQILPSDKKVSPNPGKKTRLSVHSILFNVLNFLSVMVFCVIAWMFYSGNHEEYRSARLYIIGKIDNCPVYLFYQDSPEMAESRLSVIKKISSVYAPCVPGNVYLAQPEDSVIYSGEGRVFVSRCAFRTGSKSLYSDCKNVYRYE